MSQWPYISLLFCIVDVVQNVPRRYSYHGVELGQVRLAVVNKLVGVEFNVINVACILFFRTISIRTKI